jgi:hypothetical protein
VIILADDIAVAILLDADEPAEAVIAEGEVLPVRMGDPGAAAGDGRSR